MQSKPVFKIVRFHFVSHIFYFHSKNPPLQVHCTAKEDNWKMCVFWNMIVRSGVFIKSLMNIRTKIGILERVSRFSFSGLTQGQTPVALSRGYGHFLCYGIVSQNTFDFSQGFPCPNDSFNFGNKMGAVGRKTHTNNEYIKPYLWVDLKASAIFILQKG